MALALLALAGVVTACLPVRPLPLPKPPSSSTTTTTTVRPTTTTTTSSTTTSTTTPSTTTTTTTSTSTTLPPVQAPSRTVVAVPSVGVGGAFAVSVPCSPRAGSRTGVVAIAALVAADSTVLATASASSTQSSVPMVDVVLPVPADAAPGDYSITSSCDSYLGSTVFDPVAVTVV